MLPSSGAVLGIDVGYSTKRRSSAVCRLAWDEQRIDWMIKRYRAIDAERHDAIETVVDSRMLLAVALDGPMRANFDLIDAYRAAECMLTRSVREHIGKPGQSSAPVGKQLNEEANRCAELVLQIAEVGAATHQVRIDERCVVEAFPTSFLGLMLANPAEVKAVRKNRSDIFFENLTGDGTLTCLLRYLLPGRSLQKTLQQVRNHDDRASLICALTALGVAAKDYCAVGDKDGWIILPPRSFIQLWAWKLLETNAVDVGESTLYSTH